MKISNGLNSKGRESAKRFLLKYDKNAESINYNMQIAIDEISQKVDESESHHYELRAHDTLLGIPQVISFSNDELNFVEIED